MIHLTWKKVIAAVALGAAFSMAAATTGCELITDFDRTKIDAGAVDATVGGGEGGPGVDGGEDTGADGALPADGGSDANDATVIDAADANVEDADDSG